MYHFYIIKVIKNVYCILYNTLTICSVLNIPTVSGLCLTAVSRLVYIYYNGFIPLGPFECLDLKENAPHKFRTPNGSWWYMDIQTCPSFGVICVFQHSKAPQNACCKPAGVVTPTTTMFLTLVFHQLVGQGRVSWWKMMENWDTETGKIIWLLFLLYCLIQKMMARVNLFWGFKAVSSLNPLQTLLNGGHLPKDHLISDRKKCSKALLIVLEQRKQIILLEKPLKLRLFVQNASLVNQCFSYFVFFGSGAHDMQRMQHHEAISWKSMVVTSFSILGILAKCPGNSGRHELWFLINAQRSFTWNIKQCNSDFVG